MPRPLPLHCLQAKLWRLTNEVQSAQIFLVSGILFLFLILYIELVTRTASIAQLLDFLDDGRWFSSLVKYVPLSKIVIIGTLLLIAIVFAAYAITRND